MKEQILKLRSEGKTYIQIKNQLNCSLSTISYYCGKGQKEKNKNRRIKRFKNNSLHQKINNFCQRTISEKVRSFERRKGSSLEKRKIRTFKAQDVIEKFGNNPVCYLTGRQLDLKNSKDFHFDHIIPSSKGGSNLISNLGLTDGTVNKMKHDLTFEEFVNKCKEVLEYQGYEVKRKVD